MTPVQQIPYDPVLPHLSTVLNSERMVREFEAQLSRAMAQERGGPTDLVRVDRCRIDRIKYKPRRNCLIQYRLEVRDSRAGMPVEQAYTARLYEPGGAASRFRKAQGQPLVAPRVGPPLLHLDALEMVAWAFPNDRKLFGLSSLADEAALRQEVLPEIVASRWGKDWRIDEVRAELAHLVPEQTCCIRADLKIVKQSNGESRTWRIFGKTYYDGQGEVAYANMRALWESSIRRGGDLTMARPLRYQPDERLLWQEGLPGRTLLEVSGRGEIKRHFVARSAQVIAALHRADLDCPGESGIDQILEKLHRTQSLVELAKPACAEIVAAVVKRLELAVSTLESGTRAVLHRDLHPKNIIVDGDEVAFIDLDDLAFGMPLQDIGGFIATVLYRTLLCGIPLGEAERTIKPFVETYRARVPWPVPPQDVGWHTAAALVSERVYRCITRLKPGQFELVDDVVALADRVSRRPAARRAWYVRVPEGQGQAQDEDACRPAASGLAAR